MEVQYFIHKIRTQVKRVLPENRYLTRSGVRGIYVLNLGVDGDVKHSN